MIFLAQMLFRDIGRNIKKSEVVYRVGISTLSILFALFHAYFCILFAVYGLYSLIPVSLICLVLYIFIIMMNRKRESGTSGMLFVFVPASYALICVYMFGWNFGAQWYLLALIAPVYLIYEEFSSIERRLCIFLLIISMLLVYYIVLFMPRSLEWETSYTVLEVSNVLLALFVSVMAAEVLRFSSMFSKRRYRSKLANLTDESNRDPLTNLWNRRYIENALTNLFWDDAVSRERTFIASVDIDHFKAVNDEYGHNMGDDVLRKFAQIMNKAFRGTDLTARWGGETFLVILNDTDEKGAIKALENFRSKLKYSDFVVDDVKFDIGVTIGYVSCNVDETYEECIMRSNVALSYGKSNGRGIIVNYRDVTGAKSY
jgi:diguanylate cyclase (GGDEF)-like protein